MDNIVLTGFMGTGKSVVGAALAQVLGWSFVDIDKEVETMANCTITDIFATAGEKEFRRLEEEVIAQIMEGSQQVVATGGGAILSATNRQRLRERGIVICLTALPETIVDRVGDSHGRPLLAHGNPLERVKELLNRRASYYQSADLTVQTDGREPTDVAQVILSRLGWQGNSYRLQLVRVNVPVRGYNIYVRTGMADQVANFLPTGLGPRVLVIADSRVADLFGSDLLETLRGAGLEVYLTEVPSGEGAKTLDQAQVLYQEALAAKLDRHSAIIALGGGVVGDLAGFVAATYMRGIPFIQIPTTLLAQVDSSVGGKVGVNLPQGKNLVGSFYQPRAVLIDPTFLQTLPRRELQGGLAEVVKYALVFSPEFLNYLEAHLPQIMACVPQQMGQVVARCCQLKATVVEQDQWEQGEARMLLNFGHTVGHALEKTLGFGVMTHGEAVAVGMVAACRLSARLGLAPSGLSLRTKTLLEKIGLPTGLGNVKIETIIENITYDKKARNRQVPFILLRGVGEPVVIQKVPGAVLHEVLTEMMD